MALTGGAFLCIGLRPHRPSRPRYCGSRPFVIGTFGFSRLRVTQYPHAAILPSPRGKVIGRLHGECSCLSLVCVLNRASKDMITELRSEP